MDLLAAALVALLAAGPAEPPRALVFTRTQGFRHASIPAGRTALRALGREAGLRVTASEDAGAFTPANLRRYRVVVFLNTTGDVLGPAQQEALRRWVLAGGGWVGVHAATDTEHGWPWYATLAGARFAGHPRVQRATVVVVDRRHPSTRGLPARWSRSDEWYRFDRRPPAHVLARLDESTYDPEGAAMGADHPIAWCRTLGRGRSWYTAGGHTAGAYGEPAFRRHLLGGLRWAAGLAPGTC